MRKTKLIIAFTIALLMLLCSCSPKSLPPWDIPGSDWVDQTNGISFSVPVNTDDTISGTYSINDEYVDLIVMHKENRIAFFDEDSEGYKWEDALLSGSCKYDELIMTVIVESSSIETIEEGSAIFFFKSDPNNQIK